MGNDDRKDDLIFSEEELSDIERGLENRSQLSPSGRVRRKTHRKGLRVPADIVPHRQKQSEDAEPAARKASSKTLPFGMPVVTPPIPRAAEPPVPPVPTSSAPPPPPLTAPMPAVPRTPEIPPADQTDRIVVNEVGERAEPEEAPTEPYLAAGPVMPIRELTTADVPISVEEPEEEAEEVEETEVEETEEASRPDATPPAPPPVPPPLPAVEPTKTIETTPVRPEPEALVDGELPAPALQAEAEQEAEPEPELEELEQEPEPELEELEQEPEREELEQEPEREEEAEEQAEAEPPLEQEAQAEPGAEAPEEEAEPELTEEAEEQAEAALPPEQEAQAEPEAEAPEEKPEPELAELPEEEAEPAGLETEAEPELEAGMEAAEDRAEQPEPEPAEAEADETEEGDTLEIPEQVVRKAVREAIRAAATSVTSKPDTAFEKSFDVDDPTLPGASEALEELSARHKVTDGDEGEADAEVEDQERANRVAILLSALQTPAKRRAKRAEPPPEPAEPDRSELATVPLKPLPAVEPPAGEPEQAAEPEQTAEPESAEEPDTAVETEPAKPAPGAPVSPFPLAKDLVSPPAEEAARPSELEELSGDELEEVHAEQQAAAPPPIPDAPPLSPFDHDGEKGEAVVSVPVRRKAEAEAEAEPEPEDDVITSAPVLHDRHAKELGRPPTAPQPAASRPPQPPSAAPQAPSAAPQPPSAAPQAPPAAPQVTPPAVPPVPPAAPRAAAPAEATAPQPRLALARGRKRKKAWFEEIFDDDWLRTLRPCEPKQTGREVDFLEESLQPTPDSEILDLGCGAGRHTIELASRGYKVTGYDLSLPLLIRAADEAQRRNLQINFVHGDFRELAFEEQYDAVFCLATSFGYFDDDSNRKMIHAVNDALRVGGRFMLDVVNRDYAIRDLPARIWWEGEGSVVLEEVDFNYFTSRVISKRSVVFEDGRHLEQEFSVRSYSLHELGKILHHAGFRVLEVSGHVSHRARFFGNHSRSLVLLAEKRGH